MTSPFHNSTCTFLLSQDTSCSYMLLNFWHLVCKHAQILLLTLCAYYSLSFFWPQAFSLHQNMSNPKTPGQQVSKGVQSSYLWAMSHSYAACCVLDLLALSLIFCFRLAPFWVKWDLKVLSYSLLSHFIMLMLYICDRRIDLSFLPAVNN